MKGSALQANKKGRIALFDSLQTLILTINGLLAEEPCALSEGHSYREYAL